MNRVLLAALLLASTTRAAEVRLSVVPMAAPRPALKYQFLPEVRELLPGNAVQWYLRSFQEQRNFFFNKAAIEERARYRTMSLASLPGEMLRTYGRGALTQADYAARLDTADWQILQRVQSEGLDLVLSELGPLRTLAEALQVRFRGAVAAKQYDEATGTAKTMFALARHLSECPTGPAAELGLAVANLTLDTLEEMVQQPGCPNLYWALTDLPSPLVNVRKGLQGDAVLAAADLRRLRDEPMSEEDLEELVSRLSGAIGFLRNQSGRPPRNLRAVLRAGVKDADRIKAGRSRLSALLAAANPINKAPSGPREFFNAALAVGRVESQALLYPATQVLLLEEKHKYEVERDERLKLLGLAPWQLDRIKVERPTGLFVDLLPDVAKVRRDQARVDGRVALLRHVEALRMYAAANAGKLPATLADCPVPVPEDPFTGKPFRYEVEGPTAHLRGGAKESADHVHYQVTLRQPR